MINDDDRPNDVIHLGLVNLIVDSGRGISFGRSGGGKSKCSLSPLLLWKLKNVKGRDGLAALCYLD